jgi:hypothetical protein
MINFLFKILPLFVFLMTGGAIPLYSQPTSLTAHAQLLAGMKASDQHPQAMLIENSEQWLGGVQGQTAKHFWDLPEMGTRQNQLNKEMLKREEIALFLSQHFSEAHGNTRNVFYPYGGPDFCYPDLFFPKMKNLIIVGKEQIGSFPDVQRLLNSGNLADTMWKVGNSFANLPFRSYFVTATMVEEFQEYGIATILAVSVVLAGYDIVDYQEIALDQEGILQLRENSSELKGIKIVYKKHAEDRERNIYYFCFDLFQKNLFPHFAAFVKQMGIDTAFFKATSYMTQSPELAYVNELALDHAQYLIQGETGIPYCQLNPKKWNIKLFGIYARPYFVANVDPNWCLQTDLRDIYISLIWKMGSENIVNILKMIWPTDIRQEALHAKKPSNIVWEGIVPFRFDYGGALTEARFQPYTSAIQYAIKK